MPTSSTPDGTPAWIKGDLPAESPETRAEPDTGEAAGQPGQTGVGAEPHPVESDAAAGRADLAHEQPEPKGNAGVDEIAALPMGGMDQGEPDLANMAPVADPASSDTVPQAAQTLDTATGDTLHSLPELDAFPMAPNGAEKAPPGFDDSQPAPAAKVEPPPLEPPVVELLSLEALIESLLFVADGAVPVARLAEALEVSNREIEAALVALAEGYRHRGLSLQRIRDKVQLTTSPSSAAKVERFLGLAAATPLSRAALEALAIVAYQQPVTRPQIEAVRGVNSDSVIKNLLIKGLIEESGRAEGPGRPVLYSTSPEFMQHFGLASLSDLPPLSLPGPEGAASPERILKG